MNKYNYNVTAVVLVAGNSTRFNQKENKNLFKINGRELMLYSIEELDKSNIVNLIILVVKKEEKEKIEEILNNYNFNTEIKIIVGGKDRRESVYNAIRSTDSEIIIIQDGARPFLKQEYIYRCIEEIDKFSGVTVGIKAKDTVKITNNLQVVKNTTNRKNTWLVQTPQCFKRNILLKCHQEVIESDRFTDDCTLLEENGYDIKIIQGEEDNIKVTTYNDILLVKTYIKLKEKNGKK